MGISVLSRSTRICTTRHKVAFLFFCNFEYVEFEARESADIQNNEKEHSFTESMIEMDEILISIILYTI